MIVLERPNAFRLFFTMKGSILPRIARSLATCTALAIIVTKSRRRIGTLREILKGGAKNAPLQHD